MERYLPMCTVVVVHVFQWSSFFFRCFRSEKQQELTAERSLPWKFWRRYVFWVILLLVRIFTVLMLHIQASIVRSKKDTIHTKAERHILEAVKVRLTQWLECLTYVYILKCMIVWICSNFPSLTLESEKFRCVFLCHNTHTHTLLTTASVHSGPSLCVPDRRKTVSYFGISEW